MNTIIIAKPYNDTHEFNKPVDWLESLPLPGDHSFGLVGKYLKEYDWGIVEGITITSNEIITQPLSRRGKLQAETGHSYIDNGSNWFPLFWNEQ